ncbi:MAG: hypothetical protein H7249_14015 [Chitinophagaceae bacterium]|nr:hypothetical protein [Oligoflexus sp.]
MEELSPFTQYLVAMNQWRRKMNIGIRTIGVIRSLLLAICLFLLWAWIKPEAWGQQVSVFFVTLIVCLILSWTKGLKQNTASEWSMSLEMRNPTSNPSALKMKSMDVIDPVWIRNIEEDISSQKFEGRSILMAKAASMLIPILMLFLFYESAGKAWDSAIYSIERAALTLSYGARIQVLEGSPKDDRGPMALGSSRNLEITVVEQNLIELTVNAAPDAAPLLQLKDKEGKVMQTFKLVRTGDARSDEAAGHFNLRFAQAEDADLFLSTISTSKPVASIKVKKLPVPKVTLTSAAREGEPWADDKPLPLTIEVKADNPLQVVQLHIKSGERESRELVSEVMAQDKKSLTTRYNLALETYVEQDVQDIEIIAEAMDRSIPVPLVGRSKPIVIQVASAYGRYRMALDSLRQIKTMLDSSLQSQTPINGKEMRQIAEKVQTQADDSPFFDGLDRQQLNQLGQAFEQLETKPNMPLAMKASEGLNRFLFEHENLDDRERDRDFFIAARTLSRVLEQDKKERKLEVEDVSKKLQNFVKERQARWEKRVDRLTADNKPPSWKAIKENPIDKGLASIKAADDKGDTRQAIQTLSRNVERYRQWIEELEGKEDASRKQQEESRQQGLADARNVMRELQRRQGTVSTKLDKADSRKKEELEQSWNSVRMDQNSNIKGAKELEGELRSLSPEAGERVKAAAEAMEATVGNGSEGKFGEAETSSDVAGRLLQQADSAARQSQQESQQRGRRRRVSSDQYYGNQVTGGDVDLKRNYQVNRRYREDVLNDIRDVKRQESSEETDTLLEDYLRRVIR